MKAIWPLRTTSVLLIAVAARWLVSDAAAQAEEFGAQFRNNYGTSYSLTICKTGNRLAFKMSGMARCEATVLRNDGTFSTYCGGFLSVGNSRGQLYGNLETVVLEPIAYLGGATFKLTQRPPGKGC